MKLKKFNKQKTIKEMVKIIKKNKELESEYGIRPLKSDGIVIVDKINEIIDVVNKLNYKK